MNKCNNVDMKKKIAILNKLFNLKKCFFKLFFRAIISGHKFLQTMEAFRRFYTKFQSKIKETLNSNFNYEFEFEVIEFCLRKFCKKEKQKKL